MAMQRRSNIVALNLEFDAAPGFCRVAQRKGHMRRNDSRTAIMALFGLETFKHAAMLPEGAANRQGTLRFDKAPAAKIRG